MAAYFKSTDGHYGNWSFNLRRPNLHLLPIIIDSHGWATDCFLTAQILNILCNNVQDNPRRLNSGWKANTRRILKNSTYMVCCY